VATPLEESGSCRARHNPRHGWILSTPGRTLDGIPGGKTISLGTHTEFGDPRYAANATGTALAYGKYGSDPGVADGSLVLIALPSGRSQTLVDGAAEESGNSIWSPRGNWLAFCHGPKGGAALASLTLVAADGSTRIDVSSTSSCYAFTFSPDDAWLVYPEIDSAGGTRVLTYSLKDRSSVQRHTQAVFARSAREHAHAHAHAARDPPERSPDFPTRSS
jgi:hypothetical protein